MGDADSMQQGISNFNRVIMGGISLQDMPDDALDDLRGDIVDMIGRLRSQRSREISYIRDVLLPHFRVRLRNHMEQMREVLELGVEEEVEVALNYAEERGNEHERRLYGVMARIQEIRLERSSTSATPSSITTPSTNLYLTTPSTNDRDDHDTPDTHTSTEYQADD